ncbi:MAG: type II CAAX prenyl endopeptidase Rce1 family protein [Chthoniobacterales bacterium]
MNHSLRKQSVTGEPTEHPAYPWRIFGALLGAAVIGYAAVVPYALAAFEKVIAGRKLPLPLPVLIVLQTVQVVIIFGVIIALGLLLARKVGFETPFLRAWFYGLNRGAAGKTFCFAAAVGLVTGAATLLLFYGVVLPWLPGWPSEASIAFWKRALASLYGGIDEELQLRLFLLPLVLWIIGKARRAQLKPSPGTFWFANILVALLFGAAHLPAAAAMMHLTPAVVGAIVMLNAGAGAVFGYVAWTRGLEAAIVAHFSADLVLHLVGPLFAGA